MNIDKKDPPLRVFISGMIFGLIAIGAPVTVYIYRTGGLY